MKLKLVNNFALIDGDNLFHRIRYALKTMSSDKVIRGMRKSLQIIKGNIVEHPESMIIVWDAGRSGRAKIFPEYKVHRHAKQSRSEIEEIRNLFKQIKHSIKQDGYCTYYIKGYEADDVIASFSYLFRYAKNFRAVLITEDKDYLQLVSKSCVLFRPIRSRWYTLKNFEEMTELKKPRDYIKFLALMGDKVDGIPGIPGIGEKRAKVYILNPDSLTDTIIQKINSNKELYEKCYKAVKLKRGLWKKHPMKQYLASCGVKFNGKE